MPASNDSTPAPSTPSSPTAALAFARAPLRRTSSPEHAPIYSATTPRRAAERHEAAHPLPLQLPYHLGAPRPPPSSAPSSSTSPSSASGPKPSLWSRFVSRLNRAADEGSIAQLVQLGYGRHEAAAALAQAGGDPRAARDALAHARHVIVLGQHAGAARRVYPECALCRGEDRRRRSAERAARRSSEV